MADTRVLYARALPHDHPIDLPEQALTHIGGNVWRLEIGRVIETLDRGRDRFYTINGDRLSWVEVVDGPYGRFLRTRGPEGWTDDLVRLPGFPATYGTGEGQPR